MRTDHRFYSLNFGQADDRQPAFRATFQITEGGIRRWWPREGARGDEVLVRLAGIEPTTLGFGGQYSIH